MRNHTELLNYLAAAYSLDRYLEIGIYSRQHNINKMQHCKYKIGVDPSPTSGADFLGTSDEYFEFIKNQPIKFDLVFIDGLHHADQVKRDFENSLRHLNDGGFIVLHDCNPHSEDLTSVPRAKKGSWLGDVYKFILTLREYDGIDFRTGDFDTGCCVVWKDERKKGVNERNPIEQTTWKFFKEHRRFLRLVPANTLINTIFETRHRSTTKA